MSSPSPAFVVLYPPKGGVSVIGETKEDVTGQRVFVEDFHPAYCNVCCISDARSIKWAFFSSKSHRHGGFVDRSLCFQNISNLSLNQFSLAKKQN